METEEITKALTEEEVDKRVELWHNGHGLTKKLEEYLGWTWYEYATWLEKGILPKE